MTGGLFVPAADHAKAAHYHRARGFCGGLAGAGLLLIACALWFWPKPAYVHVVQLVGGGGGGGEEIPPLREEPAEAEKPAVSALPN